MYLQIRSLHFRLKCGNFSVWSGGSSNLPFLWLFELSELLIRTTGDGLKKPPPFFVLNFKHQGLIMNKEVFNGFPQYIRITICAQIKKLLSTPYFGYDDREDIAQDMLCHYLYKFYEIPDVDEALVVHDLRNMPCTCWTNESEPAHI